MELDALLVALLLSMMVGGGYTEWTSSSLSTPCENMVEVQLKCPGRPCEECSECVTEFVLECQCIPMSFLEEYPNLDPFNACWFFYIYDWTEPKCCEGMKDLKRNGVPLGSGEPASQNIGLRPDIADTNKRANGQLDNTTSASQDGINTSRIGQDDTPLNENNNNDDSIVNDLTNIDITEKDSGNEGSNTNKGSANGKGETDTETQNDNRTRPVTNKNDQNDEKGDELESTDSARNKRHSLLMRALILTQELLTAEDMRRDIRYRDRFK